MLIGIIGENCSGKSTLAEALRSALGGEIVAGRDYLRLARSESEALRLFGDKLRAAVDGDDLIYVSSDPEQAALLPEGAVRILVSADLDTIKRRFAARMHGQLPGPVAAMLERKHGIFDEGVYDYRYDGVSGDPAALCRALLDRRDER